MEPDFPICYSPRLSTIQSHLIIFFRYCLLGRSFEMERQSSGDVRSSETLRIPYQYSPLDEEAQEIRLLTLVSGTFSSEIRVILHTGPLTNESIPVFEALSYTWGSAQDLVDIFIGDSGHHTLSVTRNLAEALPYLRYNDLDRVIWIDAICINQQDLAERSSQVKRMSDIYSGAWRVVIWLGTESHGSALALKCMRKVTSEIDVDSATYSITSRSDGTTFPSQWRQTQPPLEKEELLAICDLFNRGWFERLWVWQEVRLAREAVVRCGDLSVPWECVRTMAFLLVGRVKSRFLLQSISRERINLVHNLSQGGASNPLERAIDDTKHCVCADPRDRIFALLSTLHVEYASAGFIPDYSKSVERVYQDVVVELLRKLGSLQLLTTVEIPHLEGASSWVPDWSTPRISRPLIAPNACKVKVLERKMPQNGILEATGVLVEKIELVEEFQIPLQRESASKTALEVRRVVTQVRHRARCLGLSEDPEALYRTLFCDTFAERSFPDDLNYSTLQNGEDSLLRVLEGDLDLDGPETDLPIDMKRIIDLMRHFCPGRCLFVCADGRVGMGPRGIQSGDLVVVLIGCPAPIVLRPTVNNRYKVIGEAFFRGVMDGEALFGPFPGSFQPVLRYSEELKSNYMVYIERESGMIQAEDPRLGELPPDWVLRNHEEDKIWSWFENEAEEEGTGTDPRLTIETIKERGILLQDFELV
jgi:hypothetical protein